MTKYCTHWQHYRVTEISRKSPKSDFTLLANYCLLFYGTTTKSKRFKFKMSVAIAKHQACFTTKLQGQNLVTFSHSAVMPIAYLQHTVNTNKTCVNYALKNLRSQ